MGISSVGDCELQDFLLSFWAFMNWNEPEDGCRSQIVPINQKIFVSNNHIYHFNLLEKRRNNNIPCLLSVSNFTQLILFNNSLIFFIMLQNCEFFIIFIHLTFGQGHQEVSRHWPYEYFSNLSCKWRQFPELMSDQSCRNLGSVLLFASSAVESKMRV